MADPRCPTCGAPISTPYGTYSYAPVGEMAALRARLALAEDGAVTLSQGVKAAEAAMFVSSPNGREICAGCGVFRNDRHAPGCIYLPIISALKNAEAKAGKDLNRFEVRWAAHGPPRVHAHFARSGEVAIVDEVSVARARGMARPHGMGRARDVARRSAGTPEAS